MALQKRGEQMRKLIPPACYCSNHLNSPNRQMCCLPNVLPWKPLHTGYVNQFLGSRNIACYPKQKKTTSLGNSPHLIPPNMVSITLLPIQRKKKNIMHQGAPPRSNVPIDSGVRWYLSLHLESIWSNRPGAPGI